LEAIEQQVPEPDWPLCLLLGLQATGAELRDKGEVIEDPQAQQEKLVEACRRFRQERLPLLQALGAVALAPT
jgi:hypothetical protein